jgi:hypothetical protein
VQESSSEHIEEGGVRGAPPPRAGMTRAMRRRTLRPAWADECDGSRLRELCSDYARGGGGSGGMMAEGGVWSSHASSAWPGAAAAALATPCVLMAWGEHGIMSSHPFGAHGRLHVSEPGAAGSCEWSACDREPPMSMPAMSIPAMPGMGAISPSPGPAPGRHVKPLPTSVSWASSRTTKQAVARRSWRTHERYDETTVAHSPDFPSERNP